MKNKIDNRSTRDKALDDMRLDEQVDYWTGQLIISIGRGDFRGTVCGMILAYLAKGRKVNKVDEHA